MPEQRSLADWHSNTRDYGLEYTLYGPVKPSEELRRNTQRALKAHSDGRDYFTEITLDESRQGGAMRVTFNVVASSIDSAKRVGAVYLGQLCDLISAATRAPVRFFESEDQEHEERVRIHRRGNSSWSKLTEPEWIWITGNLVFLRREHPRFLAASSWYRKGLTGGDTLDVYCCFWRVIERLALSYADKSQWSQVDIDENKTKKYVEQLTADLFQKQRVPALLADNKTVSKVLKLRNDLSHGNEPITPDVIESASGYLKSLEESAFAVLHEIRRKRLVSEF